MNKSTEGKVIEMSKSEVIQQTEVGNYTWHGATMGVKNKYSFETFSVGIFQVIAKSGGKGKKAAPVIFRVKGATGHEDYVNRCAKYICDGLDNFKPATRAEASKIARQRRDEFLVLERVPW